MSKDNNPHFFSAGELSEYIEGNLKSSKDDIHSHTGLVKDSDLIEFLNLIQNVYDGSAENMPYHIEDTKVFKELIKNNSTKVATKAIENGNVSQMKFITGMQDYSNDVSGIHTLRKLLNMLDKDAFITYLFGHMGNGKTDFAILLGELGKQELNKEIVTNIKSLKEKDKYIRSYGDLLEYLAQDTEYTKEELHGFNDIEIENRKDFIAIFDESSQEMSGYSQDAYNTQQYMGKLTKLIRKFGGILIFIGHTGKDVHPDLRRLVNYAIHKVSKKTAIFGESVDNAQLQDEQFSLSNIPPTNYTYDTLEVSQWSWNVTSTQDAKDLQDSKSLEERNIEIAKAFTHNQHPEIEPNKQGEITQEMLADHYNLSAPRISQIFQEMINEVNQ